MDSKLEPPRRTTPMRQAEPSDHRHAIKREDHAGDPPRRQPRPHPEEPQDQWDDETIVSINALRAFLTQLLTDAGQLLTVPQKPAATTYDPYSKAARAAQAYGGSGPVTPPPAASNNTKLSAEEIAEIHHLNHLLDQLGARNITELRIIKSGRFLQSLTSAATTALANKP